MMMIVLCCVAAYLLVGVAIWMVAFGGKFRGEDGEGWGIVVLLWPIVLAGLLLVCWLWPDNPPPR